MNRVAKISIESAKRFYKKHYERLAKELLEMLGIEYEEYRELSDYSK